MTHWRRQRTKREFQLRQIFFKMPLRLIGTGFLTGMFQWKVIFLVRINQIKKVETQSY